MKIEPVGTYRCNAFEMAYGVKWNIKEPLADKTELYTESQLAAAVAAETERCAMIGLKHAGIDCAAAIRSEAK